MELLNHPTTRLKSFVRHTCNSMALCISVVLSLVVYSQTANVTFNSILLFAYMHTGCSLNIVFFRRFISKVYSGLWSLSVFPRCQWVYTMAGQTSELQQQNLQSSEKSQHFEENTIFNEHPVPYHREVWKHPRNGSNYTRYAPPPHSPPPSPWSCEWLPPLASPPPPPW